MYSLSDFTTKVDESKPSDGVATGSIIGAVVGILLILIIGVIIGCIAYKYLKRKKTRHDDTERKKPISDDGKSKKRHFVLICNILNNKHTVHLDSLKIDFFSQIHQELFI